jgi:NAD+ kinase
MPCIKKLALIVHLQKKNSETLAHQLAEIAKKNHVTTHIITEYPLAPDTLKGYDACAVIGGDGTLLSTVEQATLHQIPTFGINQGRLGFLTSLSSDNIEENFTHILHGGFEIAKRHVLEIQLDPSHTLYALNDIVIKHSHLTRMITLNVYANNTWVTDYTSDGIIIATPTGSTAYNLSANGPLIHPETDAFVMTPICPHTFSNRSLIFPITTTLTLQVKSPHPPHISIDGQMYTQNNIDQPITVKISSKPFLLLQTHTHTYFETLRKKFLWGHTTTH